MVEAKGQEHNFSKLWSANFPLFLSMKVFKILHFVKFLISKKAVSRNTVMNAILEFYMLATM